MEGRVYHRQGQIIEGQWEENFRGYLSFISKANQIALERMFRKAGASEQVNHPIFVGVCETVQTNYHDAGSYNWSTRYHYYRATHLQEYVYVFTGMDGGVRPNVNGQETGTARGSGYQQTTLEELSDGSTILIVGVMQRTYLVAWRAASSTTISVELSQKRVDQMDLGRHFRSFMSSVQDPLTFVAFNSSHPQPLL